MMTFPVRLQTLAPLAATILIALIYVWSSTWFVTTDGPSHAYNAWVLGKLLFGNGEVFHEQLEIFWFPFPNWTGHVMMMALQQLFPVNAAEKVLFSIYVITFLTGYFKWAKASGADPGLMVSLMALFLFPQTFAVGFFNNQFGFALLPWVMMSFLNFKHTPTWRNWTNLLLSSLLLYFTHPVPYLTVLLVIGCWLAFENQWWRKDMLNTTWKLLLAFLPSILFFSVYLWSTVSSSFSAFDQFKVLWHGFLELSSLTNYNINREKPVNIGISIFLALLAARTVVFLWKQKPGAFQWAIVSGFTVTALVYFFQPQAFASAGILSFRIQYVPYLFVIWLIVSVRWNRVLASVVSWISIAGCLLMLNVRLPHKLESSEAVEEMMTASAYLKEGDVSVGLSCLHNGCNREGKPISRSSWTFTHVADYLNTSGRQLSLVNYESGLFHFLIHWKRPFNAYPELGCRDGLEHIPPCLYLGNVEKKLGVKVDHVFLVFANCPGLKEHPDYQQTMANLRQAGFQHVYSSEQGVIELYSRPDHSP